MEEKIYKFGDIVPQAGKYQCVVCGVIVEYLPKHIMASAKFGVCPQCLSGSDAGPKKAHDDVWRFMGI
jgi:uncharacterized Fe-S center protein